VQVVEASPTPDPPKKSLMSYTPQSLLYLNAIGCCGVRLLSVALDFDGS